MRVRDFFGPEVRARALELLPGYEDRPGQLAMAEAVERALDDGHPLFVEAGTGTGKTLAYLLPAVLSGRKVVVSTATRALEEQIFNKDLPLVRELVLPYGIDVPAALMKGLPNYLCKRRLAEVAATSGTQGDRWLAMIDDWSRETETGDRAELAALPEDQHEAWGRVQSSADTRIGATCKYYESCFVTRMRREAEDARIVVVNHHLFLADLALRRGRGGEYASAIPTYDAVIFDEAHQLEDIATDFFGTRVSTSRVDALARDARTSMGAAGLLDAFGHGEGAVLVDVVEQAARGFFAAFAASDGPGAPPSRGPQRRPTAGAEARRMLTAASWNEGTRAAHDRFAAALAALAGWAENHVRDESMALVTRRARDLTADLQTIVTGVRSARAPAPPEDDALAFPVDEAPAPPDDDEAGASVAWIEQRERSTSIGASLIDVGPTLRASLFDRTGAVVCTSATLATTSSPGEASFHFARARLGAPPGTAELIAASPFDFERRAVLYVPRDLPEPSAPTFEAAAVQRIVELVEVTRGGAFVLCTSNRAMRALHRALAARLRGHAVMLQGDAPKHVILARFRSAGDAVLVATMSFWEGVDVPGRALRLVVMDKIPFAVPTDPIVVARCAQIEREGGNPFSQYSVPSAAITLKQGFGRLLRTQRDYGIVAVLDRRVTTRGYGKMLLAALPPARRVTELDALRAAWATMSAEDSDATAPAISTATATATAPVGRAPGEGRDGPCASS